MRRTSHPTCSQGIPVFTPEPSEKYIGIRMSSGQIAIVSACDALRVRAKRWYRQSYRRSDGTRNFYANCQVGGRVVSMHRFVLGLTAADKILVDHINGNGLDNRRENLRLTSHADNMRNRRPDKRARPCVGRRQTGTTPVFFDSLRTSDNAQHDISPIEVWDFAVPEKRAKSKRPRRLLSRRELLVVQALSDGRDLSSVARELGVSPKTLATSKARASKKLGVKANKNPVPLVDVARDLGLVTRPQVVSPGAVGGRP